MVHAKGIAGNKAAFVLGLDYIMGKFLVGGCSAIRSHLMSCIRFDPPRYQTGPMGAPCHFSDFTGADHLF